MQWIVFVLLGWVVVSIAVAVILGRIIRARDQREVPPPFPEDGDTRWEDAG